MNGVYINPEEFSRLAGLPDIQFRLYIVARQWMDWATGIVGLKRGISWQSLREELYVEPIHGRKGGSPSKDQIRRAAAELEKIGLIKFSSKNSDSYQLVFKCICADRDKSAKNKAAISPPYQAAISPPYSENTSEPIHGAGCSDSGTTPKTAEAATPKKAEAATPPRVLDISLPPPPLKLIEVGGVGVEFSNLIKPDQRPVIEGYLRKVKPEDRQCLLDDFVGWLSRQSAKGVTVANPSGVVRRMVDRYARGEWAPEQAPIGKAIRLREHQAPPPPPPKRPPSPKRPPPESFRNSMAALGRKFNHQPQGTPT